MANLKKKSNEFPLWFHAPSGQGAKKIKQKVYYFGKDRDEAAKRWADEKDALFAGRKPNRLSGSPKLSELANVFHDAYQKKVDQGEMSQRHLDGCTTTLQRLIELVGADCRLDTLTPLDFDGIRTRLFEPKLTTKTARGGVTPKAISKRSLVTVDGDIRRITLFVRWVVSRKLVESVDMGCDFKPSSRKQLRKHRAKQPKKMFEPEGIRAIVDECSVSFKPIVLLAANAGIGGRDIANITFDDIKAIDEKETWIDLPRLKTGAQRRFLLWSETQQAIREYLKVRPVAKQAEDTNIVFLTRNRIPWVRDEGSKHTDSICSTFAKLRKDACVDRGSFYDLRRTFATVGGASLDLLAVRFIMGHAEDSNDMSARYNQEISDDRIRKVCDHVHDWLFPKAKKTSKKGVAK